MRKPEIFIKKPFFTLLIFTLFLTAAFFSGCRETADVERKPFSKVRTFAGITEKFGEPFGIAVKADEIFVADGAAGKIWRVAKTGAMSVFAENLDTPSGIAFDAGGDLIVADAGTHTVKRIKPTGAVELIAGVENQKGFADGAGSEALFNAPVGVAVFENKIYVADTYNDRLRVIENGQISTVAGNERGFADGSGTAAQFDTPLGLAARPDGRILVADAGNRRLRVVEPTGAVWTLAGNGNSNLTDGLLGDSEFVQPTAVAVHASGAVFVADGNAVRAIGTRSFPLVETISHDRRGFADGEMRRAQFNRPSGLAFDESGDLFVADSENQVLRVFTGAENFGRELTEEEWKNRGISAEEFRRSAPPRWTFDPPDAPRDVAGTLGEIRGEISEDPKKQAWFHNGLDIAGAYGETARFIRDEKVLHPFAAEGFGNLRERLRMPTIGYIHIRLGRDQSEKPFEDARFQFARGADGKLIDVRVPRGARFSAGEAIGTLNSFNHVHLIAGRAGAEMNAIDALEFPGIRDKIAPRIEKVSLFDENWLPLETVGANSRITLRGKTRIVVRSFDQMDGNRAGRKLGVYRLGYQILREDESVLGEANWTISFDRMPDERAVPFVYARGSQSGYTPETVFNYIVTNEVSGDAFRENFLDAARMTEGKYILRVFAADFFGNFSSEDINFEVTK